MSIVSVKAVRPDRADGIAVTFDFRERGVYTSAECQLGAHHGCPGGLPEVSGVAIVVCDCPMKGCDCYRPLRLHAVPDPEADA